jgi:hypothetical protein
MTSSTLNQRDIDAETLPAQLPLSVLAARCTAETANYLTGQPSDQEFARELFRRAIVERDEAAWEALYAQYRGMVLAWLRRHPAYVVSDNDDARVNTAFAQFWAHIPPARFDDFPTVAALLRYLKLCVHALVVNDARARAREELVASSQARMEEVETGDVADTTVGYLTANEIWAVVVATTAGEEERIIAEGTLLLGMKAAEIQVHHSTLFAEVGDVYRVKRNLFERLQRSAAIRAWRGRVARGTIAYGRVRSRLDRECSGHGDGIAGVLA